MADDVLILIDQQKAMDHPKWGPRNNPGAEANIARLLADWRRRKAPPQGADRPREARRHEAGVAVPAGPGR
jgi:hypothetical protein